MSTEERINLNFWLEKPRHKHFRCFSMCMHITSCHAHVFLSCTRGSKESGEWVKDASRSGRPSTNGSKAGNEW